MTPLEATIVVVVDFVAVVVHIVVVVVVNVVVVVVNVGVVALFVVTDHRSINVNLRLLKAKVEFLWLGGGGLESHFHVQPNFCVDVVLCCVVVGGCDNLK